MKYIALFLFVSVSLQAQNTVFSQAEKNFTEGNFSEARVLFEEFLEDHPQHLKTREYLGDIASHAEDWDKAIDFYSELVEDEEGNADFHYKYGGALGMKALAISRIRALTYIGDIKEEFKTAATLDPKHVEARWALIELYLQLPGILGGGEDKAMVYAKELQNISAVDGYLAKGYIAESGGDKTTAEALYKKAIAEGGSPHTYEKLTNLYEKNDQPAEAIENASKSFELHKRNLLNYQIGKIAAEYDMKPELGIDCLNRYIENHSYKDGVSTDWAYYRMAQIYKNMGNKQRALQCIDKALATSPDFEEALTFRSDIRNL